MMPRPQKVKELRACANRVVMREGSRRGHGSRVSRVRREAEVNGRSVGGLGTMGCLGVAAIDGMTESRMR